MTRGGLELLDETVALSSQIHLAVMQRYSQESERLLSNPDFVFFNIVLSLYCQRVGPGLYGSTIWG